MSPSILGGFEPAGDPVNMVCLDFRAGTTPFVMTSARIIRISIIVGALEIEPDCFLCEDIVDSVIDARVPAVKVQVVAFHVLVNVVVHG